jgi:membrane protein YdbS with pleckstrin-like domain
MFCYRCGNRLPEESIFCNRCGIRLQSTTERMRNSKPFDYPVSSADDEVGVAPPRAPRQAPPPRSGRRLVEEDPEDFEVEEEWEAVDSPFADDFDEEEPEDEPEGEDESIEADPPVHSYRGPRERVIFSINPAFYPVSSAYVLSTFAALLLVIIIAYFNGGFLLSLGCAMVTFVPSVIKHIRHIHTIFTLTTIKLEISEGLFSKSTRNIPLRHIQDVAVRENFKERLLGIGDIVVDTPSMESRLILNNVNNPRHYADLILEQLERWI